MLRRWLTVVLALGLTWASGGCKIGWGGQVATGMGALHSAPPPTTNAYSVDPRIEGMYDTQGEVAWVLNPGRRPTIYLLKRQRVQFQPGVTAEEVNAYARQVGAQVVKQTPLPPDTLLVDLAFPPSTGPLTDFEALLQQAGFDRRIVFSSAHGARIFHAMLKARQAGPQHRVHTFALDGVTCIPEGCGVAPDDPYGGGVAPTPAPVYLAEPHSHRLLAGNRGTTYVLGSTLYLEAPGQPVKALLTEGETTSFEYVDPELRFVLLHVRKSEMPSPLPTALTPGTAKPHPGSQLVKQDLNGGARQVLIDHFYHYELQLAVAPDGRNLAVRTDLTGTRGPGDGDARRLYLLDMEAPAQIRHLEDMGAFTFEWAPKGLALAIIGEPEGLGSAALFVIRPGERSARRVLGLGTVAKFLWFPDGERILTHWTAKKYENVVHLAISRVSSGGSEAFDLPTPAQVGEAYSEPGEMSPDGRHLLVRLSGISQEGVARVDLEVRTLTWIGPASLAPRWTADSRLVCGQGDTPCP